MSRLLARGHASFGVAGEADELSHQLGEPYGTLVLTLSIVSIEVILIAAVMSGPGETQTITRDSIFAVMMIILNLVTGICLVVGAARYGEQEYNTQGALAFAAHRAARESVGNECPPHDHDARMAGRSCSWLVQQRGMPNKKAQAAHGLRERPTSDTNIPGLRPLAYGFCSSAARA